MESHQRVETRLWSFGRSRGWGEEESHQRVSTTHWWWFGPARGVEESGQFGRGRGRKREGHVFVHIASTLVH